MRTFNKKDIYSWANCEEARQYIGKEGYFAHTLSQLDNRIQKSDFCTLEKICDSNTNCFCRSGDGVMCYWSMFLPVDKVKKVEEKKWRAFTLEEFNKTIPMGTVFKYRYKKNKAEVSIYYHAYLELENGDKAIFFEKSYRSLNCSFNELELFLNGEWQPFGVLENES